MAPHAGGSQRAKNTRLSSAPNLHQAAPNPPKQTLDEFFLDPALWHCAGIRTIHRMQLPCHDHNLLGPEQRPWRTLPRLGWFGDQASHATPTQQAHPMTTSLGRGSDRYYSQPLPQSASDLVTQYVPPAQHHSQHLPRQPSRQQVPVLPLPASLPSIPSANLSLAAPPLAPTWERPALSALLQATQRRPRSSKARHRCAREQLALRVAWLLQPAPAPALPQLAPPPPLLPSMTPLDMAFLSKMLPSVAGLAPNLSPAQQPPMQLQPVITTAPVDHTMLEALAASRVRVSTSCNQQAAVEHQGLASRVSQPHMLSVPTTPAMVSPTAATTPSRVPVILLPADGQLQHVPAVCVSPLLSLPSATCAQLQQRVGPLPTSNSQVPAVEDMASTPAAGATQQAQQSGGHLSDSPADANQVQQQQEGGPSPTQSTTSHQQPHLQHAPTQDSPQCSSGQLPHDHHEYQQGQGSMESPAASPGGGNLSLQHQQGDNAHVACTSSPQVGSQGAAVASPSQEHTNKDITGPAPLSACPATNSDASSQHGFTPLRSCGSGCVDVAEEDVAMEGAGASDSSDELHGCRREGSQAQAEVTMMVGKSGQEQQAKIAPHSPDSPLSDVDMMPA